MIVDIKPAKATKKDFAEKPFTLNALKDRGIQTIRTFSDTELNNEARSRT